MEYEVKFSTDCCYCTWYGPQGIRENYSGTGNRRKSREYPDENIVKNSKNTRKSSIELTEFAVRHTSVRHYQLTLEWKTSKE